MSLKINSYKELKFWKTSWRTSLLIVQLTRRLPNERTTWVITDQILRASFSIGANITEGFGRYRGREYSRFLQIALGSARETGYWLELLGEIYPRFSLTIEQILALNEETIKMLVATLRTLKT